MQNNISLGKLGEDFACQYLVNKGYKLICRNYRKKFGEIDIVAKDKDGTLVFVEVKTMKPGILKPEDNLSFDKLRKLKKICDGFANANPSYIREEKGWRIDLLALTQSEETFEVKHYENIG